MRPGRAGLVPTGVGRGDPPDQEWARPAPRFPNRARPGGCGKALTRWSAPCSSGSGPVSRGVICRHGSGREDRARPASRAVGGRHGEKLRLTVQADPDADGRTGWSVADRGSIAAPRRRSHAATVPLTEAPRPYRSRKSSPRHRRSRRTWQWEGLRDTQPGARPRPAGGRRGASSAGSGPARQATGRGAGRVNSWGCGRAPGSPPCAVRVTGRRCSSSGARSAGVGGSLGAEERAFVGRGGRRAAGARCGGETLWTAVQPALRGPILDPPQQSDGKVTRLADYPSGKSA